MNPLELGKSISYFWEAEGCPIIKKKTIELTSVNYEGLKQIQKMMDRLGIKTTITGPNFAASSYGLYTLRVSGRENIKLFRDLINFITPRKRNGVRETLASYKRIIKIHSYEEYIKAFKLKKEGFTLKQISKELNISPRTLKTWFYEGVKPYHPSLQSHRSS